MNQSAKRSSKGLNKIRHDEDRERRNLEVNNGVIKGNIGSNIAPSMNNGLEDNWKVPLEIATIFCYYRNSYGWE